MLDEEAFLDKIGAAPQDDSARLVYADWLEEQGDGRAAFLRAQVAGVRLPEAEAAQDPAWLARVDRTAIENCRELTFAFRCPKRWEQLARVPDDERTRFCGTCEKPVYHCATVAEAQEHARQGRCVAVNAQALRRPGDLENPEDYLLGEVEPVMGTVAVPPPLPDVLSLPPPPSKPRRWWQFWR